MWVNVPNEGKGRKKEEDKWSEVKGKRRNEI